jgi:hypothetical protein
MNGQDASQQLVCVRSIPEDLLNAIYQPDPDCLRAA